MTVAITRRELGAGELRREAGRCRSAKAARRMLALALVLEGSSREVAARAAGMNRQSLRDWVHRYDEAGLAGLRDRPRPGRRPRLTPEQEAELATVVEHGPDPARDGVGRWRRPPQAIRIAWGPRRVDLQALIAARFDVRLHERSVGKGLRRLGFARLSVRPKPPLSDPAAQEAFKKASPRRSRRRYPSTPMADRSRSGFRACPGPDPGTRPASASRAR
jgi:transposase